MADEELNKKLAEWAGFEKKLAFESGKHKFYWHVSPGGEEADVQFTTSLDACFKWLVPRVTPSNEVQIIIPPNTEKRFIAVIGHGEGIEADTPALSLCKAIEQLIDGEGKDG
jgi:hypothetical protein